MKFFFASYSASLSYLHAGLRHQLLHDDWWKSRWGDETWIVPGHDTRMEIMNNHLGEMFTSSVSGSNTGRGGDVIVIDDPLDPRQAASDTMRENANIWFKQTMASRLNDKRRGAIVIIMQRLHEEDVSGIALAEGGWTHVKIPAIAPDRERIIFPLSRMEYIREPGDVLWPARETKEMLDFLREKRMGSYAFSGQYQQEPAPDEGGILKKSWWKFYKTTDPLTSMSPRQILSQLPPMNTVAISWDMAFKDLADSDYCAGSVWGRSGANYYLLDLAYDRMDFVTARSMVEALYRKWPMAMQILIEDKANGTAIIQSLRKKIHRLIAINPTESKVARVYAVSPLLEAGNVYLPDRSCAPWIDEFILQCARFPNAAHDDFVDSMSQALTRLSRSVPEERADQLKAPRRAR